MKHLILVVIFFTLTLSSLFATTPISKEMGEIVIKPNAIEQRMLNAFSSPFNASWVKEYTTEDEAFLVSYSVALSSLLPLDNMIISKRVGDEIKIKDLDSSKLITILLEEDKIKALLIE